jgi:hypothetical protein
MDEGLVVGWKTRPRRAARGMFHRVRHVGLVWCDQTRRWQSNLCTPRHDPGIARALDTGQVDVEAAGR